MMLRPVLGAALAVLILVPVPVHAQPVFTGEAEMGWTSNVGAVAGGPGDRFVRLSHRVDAEHADEDFVLRGSLSLTQTRYMRLWQENDREAEARILGEWRLGPDMVGRVTLGLAHHEEGRAVPFGSGIMAVTTPALKGSLGLSGEGRLGDTLFVAGVDLAALGHGESVFGGRLAPLRTRADAWTLSGDLRLSHPLNETVAVTGLVRGLVQTIAAADQLTYGRVPARALRLAVGIEAQSPLRASFALEAGADMVWADRAGGMAFLPHARSEMSLALGGGFDLVARLRTSLDFESPADGFADWLIDGRIALGYGVAGAVRFEAAILASATRSVGFGVEHKRRIGGELSAEAALGGGWAARARIGHVRETGLMPGFDETRLALGVAMTL